MTALDQAARVEANECLTGLNNASGDINYENGRYLTKAGELDDLKDEYHELDALLPAGDGFSYRLPGDAHEITITAVLSDINNINIQSALNYGTVEDILDKIFSRFCLGK